MAPQGSSSTVLSLLVAMASLVASSNGLCPARCHCDDEALRASCTNSGLDVVPIQLNPGVAHMDLSRNRVSNLRMAFVFYSSLETLDLSSNLIHTLGSENFALQQKLVTLNLSSNTIHSVPKNALLGLKSLKMLDLSFNNITHMDDQAFRYTSELEYLNLCGNSITSLPKDLLKNMHVIRSLIISKNSLLEVPASNLALVSSSVENLDLADNLIQELSSKSIPAMPELIELSLANNVIRSVNVEAFENLPKLLSLDLSGNNLTSMPTAALSQLRVLTSLILSRNPLGTLQNVAFRNLLELRKLVLNDCALEFVHPQAFTDNVNLQGIAMDGNRDLKELPSRILYSARKLRWVSLRHCNLATLQPTQFPVDGLTSLRVGGNPLVCNCSVHWLWNVLRAEERRNETKLDLDTQEIICADEEFDGKPLISLPEGALRCRLSPLYLSLSAVGCLAATAAILLLIAYVTRARRRKRPAFPAPNRPELLVYVGRGNTELDKNAESYSRRLIARKEEMTYEAPNRKSSRDSNADHTRDVNLYETPRYTRPTRWDQNDHYTNHRQREDGVYAVADVTGLREDLPEVFSLYRMRATQAKPNSRDYDYDYDYDCDYEPPLPQKPHVVFV